MTIHPPAPVIYSSPMNNIDLNDTEEKQLKNKSLSLSNASNQSDNTKSMVMNYEGGSLLSKVLKLRQPQSASKLFSISDYDVITELRPALFQIKKIFNDENYAINTNDQSIVELVLSRLTAATRESSCIETYAPAFVDVLEACLSHHMYTISDNGQLQDSPHCKIALELLSTLFLYHSKKSVMTVAIPVAIKVLSNSNFELVRNTSSYLSLATIHNGRILAQYSIQIISNIINGNYSLVRVLPQIYPENREPIHAHLSPLFCLLHYSATDVSEKLCLLQLASMITNTKPDLIIPHLSKFDEFLMSPTTCTAVLYIYLSLIWMKRVDCLVVQLLPLRCAASHSPTQNNITTMAKIVGVVGRLNAKMAIVAVHDLVALCQKSNAENLPILLKEIEVVVEAYPQSVQGQMSIIKKLSKDQSLTHSAYMRIHGLFSGDADRQHLTIEKLKTSKNLNNGFNYSAENNSLGVCSNIFDTISGKFIDSAESLLAYSTSSSTKHLQQHRSLSSSGNCPNDPAPASNNYGLEMILPMSNNQNQLNVTPSVTLLNYNKESSINANVVFANVKTSPNNLSINHLSQHAIPENNSICELDRNMKTLADCYKLRSNGSLAFPNRSFQSLSNAMNHNPSHTSLLCNNDMPPVSSSSAINVESKLNTFENTLRRRHTQNNEMFNVQSVDLNSGFQMVESGLLSPQKTPIKEMNIILHKNFQNWPLRLSPTQKPENSEKALPRLFFNSANSSWNPGDMQKVGIKNTKSYTYSPPISQDDSPFNAINHMKSDKQTNELHDSSSKIDPMLTENLKRYSEYCQNLLTSPHLSNNQFNGLSPNLLSTIFRDGIQFPPTKLNDSVVQPSMRTHSESKCLLKTPVHIGKDGRVRPVSGYKYNNSSEWVPLAENFSKIYEETTVFPVNAAETVIKKTKKSSGNATKVFVDEHMSAKHCKTHSVETLYNSRLKLNIDWKDNFENRGDVVKKFVENRKAKIGRYINELSIKYPIPIHCTVEKPVKGNKKCKMQIYFGCQVNDAKFCVFPSFQTLFNFKTKIPAIWIHLMFLQIEAKFIELTGKVLSQQSEEFQNLNNCWKCLPKDVTKNHPFVTLVTSAFPLVKEQSQLLKELQELRYFDSFSFNAQNGKWACFGCAHPEKVKSILLKANEIESGCPLLEGHLKEKRGNSNTRRWGIFRRWHTKYFTLSSAALTSSESRATSNSATDKIICPSIDLQKICSVKSISRKSRKMLPRAFEVFTEDNISYVFKANDRKKAEEWFQCLQIAVAQIQRRKQYCFNEKLCN